MANKKKKQQDFKKIKIKAGKKIPKHLNETKPEFTAKKIQIKPFTNSTPCDYVKLLSGASLNTNLKLIYLGKLNQQLSNSLSSSKGGEQIQAVCKYITDEDSRVREAAISCLKACLNVMSQKTTNETLSPLLSILLSFVNCGITHINESIRRDAQKFFAFLLEKCNDSSLEDHLMQMFLSKINTLWINTLDAEYYDLLEKFVSKSIFSKKTNQHCNVNPNEIQMNEFNETKGFHLNWAPINFCIQLHDLQNTAKRFSQFQDFQLTFQNKSHVNVNEKFIDTVETMVIKDVKSLIGKDPNRTLTLSDGQKVVSILKISIAMSLQEQLLSFWGRNVKRIPSLKITNTTNLKTSLAKSEAKKVAHIQNEINCNINRIKKLLK